MLAKFLRVCYTVVMMQLRGYENKKLCVALSGGVDSVALLHMLNAEKNSGGFLLSAVHCEHGIRGEESRLDMEFVQTLCAAWKIPLRVARADCPRLAKERGESLETAARAFRYGVFKTILDGGEADYIVLAHHALDEAETVLFRLARGTSLSGAAAMKEKNGKFLRPLLAWSKEEILAYAQDNGLSWREDGTNSLLEATRNKLRLEVLPALERAVNGAGKNLAAFAKVCAEDDEYLYSLAEKLIERKTPAFTGDSGYRVVFSKEKPLFVRACLSVLKTLGVEKDYTRENLETLFRLQELQTGAKASVKGGVYALKGYDGLAFCRSEEKQEENGEQVFGFGEFRIGRVAFTVSETPSGAEKELRLDVDKLPEDAVFRLKREGDVFEKFGGGRKSLKKYLVDKKIAAAVRAELPVLAKGDEVFAVLGVEVAGSVWTNEKTKRTAYLSILI